MEKKSFRQQLAPLKPYIKLQVFPLSASFLTILGGVGLSLLQTRYNGIIIDEAIMGNWEGLLSAFKWVVGIYVAVYAISPLQELLVGGASERIIFRLRQDIVGKIGIVSSEKLALKHSGDYISRLSSDTELIQALVTSYWVSIVSSVFSASAALVYMLFISWKVVLVTIVSTPLIILISSVISKPLSRMTKELQEKQAVVNAFAQDVTGGIIVSKALLLKNYLSPRFRTCGSAVADSAVDVAYQNGLLTIVMTVVAMSPFFIIFVAGGYEVIQGRLTVGNLIVLMNLFGMLTSPLQTLGNVWGRIKAALTAATRIFELLELPSERKGGKPLLRAADVANIIEMRDIIFSYGKKRPVFTDFCLNVRRGETVAIVGPSGAGKTTLFLLLLGLCNPQAGEIFYYGQPMRELLLSDLRREIAYVSQEVLLFPGSIAENIAYGKAGATSEEIEAAAREAEVEEFVLRLPNGYDTTLGELGTGLSGGQKQRLSLARAILKNAPILLLDEATSSLDIESEAKVQAAIERLAEDRTTLVIAHRLSTIINADRIIVIDQGRIVEEGTHEELLAADKLYAALYASQFDTKKMAAAAEQ